MRIGCTRTNTEAISDTIHWGKALLIRKLVVIYIGERAVALIIQSLQLLGLFGLGNLIFTVFVQ